MKNILLISGWACPQETLIPLAAQLQSTFKVTYTTIADLYTLGIDSDIILNTPYTLGLQQILNDIEKPYAIIGWSMGALVTLDTLISVNLPVEKLVTISATPCFCKQKDFPSGTAPGFLRAMRKGLVEKTDTILHSFFKDVYYPQVLSASVLKEMTGFTAENDLAILINGLNYLRHFDLRDGLPSLEIPVMVIHGQQDFIIPASNGKALADLLPHGQLQIYQDGGHALLTSHTEKLAVEITNFLESGMRTNES